MKHLTVFFTLCFALCAFSAPAATPPAKPGNVLLKTSTLDKNDLRITLANLEQQNTQVELKSIDGKRTFMKEMIRRHNGFSMRVDLDALGDGKYLLEVEQEDEVLHQVIVIEEGRILMSKVVEGKVS